MTQGLVALPYRPGRRAVSDTDTTHHVQTLIQRVMLVTVFNERSFTVRSRLSPAGRHDGPQQPVRLGRQARTNGFGLGCPRPASPTAQEVLERTC